MITEFMRITNITENYTSTCSGLLVLQSVTLLVMVGHGASLAEGRKRQRVREPRKGSKQERKLN